MKIKELKLYSKYKDINKPNIELIYIGNENDNYYWFLYKHNNGNSSFSILKRYGFDPDKIVKDLNLGICFDKYGFKYIKECKYRYQSKKYIETNLKPILKDKLKNILNR